MPLHVRNAQCADTTRLVHTARLVNLESGQSRMLTVHIQRRLHARIRHDTEASRILWSRTCPCRSHQNNGKQNAEPLQSQFLRHANFKHVDRFCSLKQLELEKALRRRGAAKAGNAYASMSCLRLRRLRSAFGGWGQGQRGGKEVERHRPAPAPAETHGTVTEVCWTAAAAAAKVHTAHCHYCC